MWCKHVNLIPQSMESIVLIGVPRGSDGKEGGRERKLPIRPCTGTEMSLCCRRLSYDGQGLWRVCQPGDEKEEKEAGGGADTGAGGETKEGIAGREDVSGVDEADKDTKVLARPGSKGLSKLVDDVVLPHIMLAALR